MTGKHIRVAGRHPVHHPSDEHTSGHERQLAADSCGRKRGGTDDEAVYRGGYSALIGWCFRVDQLRCQTRRGEQASRESR